MDEKRAVELLLAYVYCSIPELLCEDCPMYDPEWKETAFIGCRMWQHEEVVEAVRFLRKERGE